MNGIRRFLVMMRGRVDPPAIRNPLAPVTANATTRMGRPHGMACFTAVMASCDPPISVTTVEIQKVRMVAGRPIVPAMG